MKEVAILLLAVLTLNGCGSNPTFTQTAASGLWQAQMQGGETFSGLSFITQFTVNPDGSLDITYFQFDTHDSMGSCFPVTGGKVTGSMMLTENQTNFTVTGPLSFTVQSGSNTLTLTGTVTGTENGLFGTTLSGGSVIGTWALAGGTGCNDTIGGSFTMTQSS